VGKKDSFPSQSPKFFFFRAVNIISSASFDDCSRYFYGAQITLLENATLTITASTADTMAFIPESDSLFINFGYIHAIFSLLDQTSATARFGVPPPANNVYPYTSF
jgi:hypothetical protein